MIFVGREKAQRIIRRVSTSEAKIYLTFDDGPDPELTPEVMAMLEKFEAKATFFVVAEHARRFTGLCREILKHGHAIGNHSLDHTYGNFFAGYHVLRDWVRRAQDELTELCGEAPLAFRPPNGICTPTLMKVLEDEKIPLVLWQHRFYDAILPWRTGAALDSLDETQPGDIILLHDRQPPRRQAAFLQTLEAYLTRAREKTFLPSALSPSDLSLK